MDIFGRQGGMPGKPYKFNYYHVVMGANDRYSNNPDLLEIGFNSKGGRSETGPPGINVKFNNHVSDRTIKPAVTVPPRSNG